MTLVGEAKSLGSSNVKAEKVEETVTEAAKKVGRGDGEGGGMTTTPEFADAAPEFADAAPIFVAMTPTLPAETTPHFCHGLEEGDVIKGKTAGLATKTAWEQALATIATTTTTRETIAVPPAAAPLSSSSSALRTGEEIRRGMEEDAWVRKAIAESQEAISMSKMMSTTTTMRKGMRS